VLPFWQIYIERAMLDNYLRKEGSKSDRKNQGEILTAFQKKLLLKKLQTNLRPEYRRRIEIMLLADSGKSQTQICESLSCSHETARYWIHMAKTGQAHKWDNTAVGRPKTIDDSYLERLKELINRNPRECGYSFERWTAQWLSKQLAKEFEIELSDRHINRLLKKMGLSTRAKSSRSEKLEQSDLYNSSNSNIVLRNLSTKISPKLVNFSPFQTDSF
jgi:transposase